MDGGKKNFAKLPKRKYSKRLHPKVFGKLHNGCEKFETLVIFPKEYFDMLSNFPNGGFPNIFLLFHMHPSWKLNQESYKTLLSNSPIIIFHL